MSKMCKAYNQLYPKAYIDNKNINLIPIKSMAPNVKYLEFELKIHHTAEFDMNIAPFSDIWRFWPQLVGLKITVVKAKYPNRNNDADFFGICEEETEILREKDQNSLRSVNIVQVMLSVLSMSGKHDGQIGFTFWCQYASSGTGRDQNLFTVLELQNMAFELTFWDWNDYTDAAPTFLSQQILAFRRMQHTAVELAWVPTVQPSWGSITVR